MSDPLVYIIVLNWNGYKDTVTCIESLKKISYKNYRILLIDNGSTDKSVEILKKKYPKIPIIVSNINVGYSAGNNLGIQSALKHGAKYILLLNNDTVVSKDFLSTLVSAAENNHETGMVSPLIYFLDNPQTIYSSGGYLTFTSVYPFTDTEFKMLDKGQSQKPKAVDLLIGCCLLIKTEVIKSIGLLDEDYFLYVEDMDYSFRAKRAGFKLFMIPQAKIWHKGSSSTGGRTSITRQYYNTRNLFLFARKNLLGRDRIIFTMYVLKGRILEILKLLIQRHITLSIASIIGTINGLTNRLAAVPKSLK